MTRAKRLLREARAWLLAAPLLAAGATAERRPNVLVILADDLGWNDLSLHGSQTPTPNIDRLAASGVAFKNLIVCPVCSPTRASFYTGCEAVRSGYGGEVGDRLNPALPTLAQVFRAAGYRTGLFGKWHTGKPGGDEPWSPTPMQAGFDVFQGFYGGGTDYYDQKLHGTPVRNWYENGRQVEEGQRYLTDLITDGAVRFIESSRNQPFFCMVAHAAPHEPFQATDALLKRVPESIRGQTRLTEERVRARSRDRASQTDRNTWEFGGFTEAERRVVYSAMKIGLDDGVGRLVEALEQAGQEKSTAVLFFSDNGAMPFIREGNLPYRAWKHNMYEGAIHVPGFLSYPAGGLAAGSSYEPMVRGLDLYPTLAELAGVPLSAVGPELDGVSHLRALRGQAPPPALEWNGIFVYYGGYRDNRWKLIAKAGASELYDLQKDPSETEDVSARYPEVVRDLRGRHEAWLRRHGACVNYSPPPLPEMPSAAPSGEVLEVACRAKSGRMREQLVLPLRRAARLAEGRLTAEDYVCTPGDRLVYDLCALSLSPGQTVYLSPSRGEAILGGAGGTGVDAGGARVCTTAAPPAPLSRWTRYVFGLGNSAAHGHADLRLVVESASAGEIRVRLDNVHILKPDGRVLPVWSGGAPPADKAGVTCRTQRLPSE